MKQIGIEVTRRYLIEVDDAVDTSDWRGIGDLLLDNPVAVPVAVETLGWEIPDGDVDSDATLQSYLTAYERRTLEVAAELDAHMALRVKNVL